MKIGRDVAGADLGRRFRAVRTAAGRTIASVATEAGLSVPYIANLENGRGNPTLATLRRLAAALGLDLSLVLSAPGGIEPIPAIPGLAAFARTERFAVEVRELAAGADEAPLRERLLTAMTAMAAARDREFSELDWHRALGALVLLHRAPATAPPR